MQSGVRLPDGHRFFTARREFGPDDHQEKGISQKSEQNIIWEVKYHHNRY